jgi:pimeloyl-ACP methyl ester carboxylesterase
MCLLMCLGLAGGAEASTATATPNIAAAAIAIAHTTDGVVAYREVGHGSPVLLVNGFSTSMDNWSPSLINRLAAHHRVVVFDNAGVGQSAALSSLSINAMATQTEALITALHLGRTAVLGWSMGGMVAQALAIDDPHQVSRLVLAATQAGNGRALPLPAAAAAAAASSNPADVLSAIFPADQSAASQAYVKGILTYPHFYEPTAAIKTQQSAAIAQWLAGSDPVGLRLAHIAQPTLVADGARDALDPAANDRQLAHAIHGARLVLYPDAGHAFLFQDAAAFAGRVTKFLS